MKKWVLFGGLVLAVSFILLGASCSKTTTTTTNSAVNQQAKSTVTLDKTTYIAGETISVTYNIIETIKSGAWIGIIPATTAHGLEDTADAVDVDYEYLSGSQKGSLEFTAPAAGSYQIRVFNDDQTGAIELASSTTFTVK